MTVLTLAHRVAKGLQLAARADVDEAHLVRDGSDDLVPALGQIGGDAALFGAERGQQQQASDFQGAFPFTGHAQVGQAAGRANDDRLFAAQQDSQALLLHRGVEAADDGHAVIPQFLGKVVCLEDQVAGASVGAKQRELFRAQNLKVAYNGELGRCGCAEGRGQADRIIGIIDVDFLKLLFHILFERSGDYR